MKLDTAKRSASFQLTNWAHGTIHENDCIVLMIVLMIVLNDCIDDCIDECIDDCIELLY